MDFANEPARLEVGLGPTGSAHELDVYARRGVGGRGSMDGGGAAVKRRFGPEQTLANPGVEWRRRVSVNEMADLQFIL